MDGYVLKLRCLRCKHTFPEAVFSGDTDTATYGLCSLSAALQNEVVIGELNEAEYKLGFDDGTEAFKQRISKSLDRTDLRLVRLVRVEIEKLPPDVRFQIFLSKYNLRRVIYSCAVCSDGESAAIEQLNWNDFQESGGRIIIVGNMELMAEQPRS